MLLPRRFAAAALASFLLWTGVRPAAAQTLLPDGTLYPRLVRIEHGGPSSAGRILASTTGRIFRSDDDGASFHLIGKVTPAPGLTERCCASLFEVPQTVGALKAGTLLYATSDYAGTTPSIEVYRSDDEGVSWRLHSTVKRAGSEHHGLWEPQFSMAADGALIVFWSDETDPCCSQKLAQSRTYDGLTWKDERNTIATVVSSDRPGMVTVARLPSGTFFMTYEVCGHFHCGVFSRTSTDGWNYGDPADLKQLVRTADGAYFEHAPQTAWVPDGGGALLVIGQVLLKNDGNVDVPNNGHVLFRNTSSSGDGMWVAVRAPLDVPRSYDNYCPNYSSALLATQHGTALLELASDYDRQRQCVTFFGTLPWQDLLPLHKDREP